MGALNHGIGNHAIDADGGESEREAAEEAEQQSLEARLRESSVHKLWYRANVCNRQILVDGVGVALDRLGYSRDAQIGSDNNDGAPERGLREWHVHHRCGSLPEFNVAHIAHDADDFARRLAMGRESENEPLADGILIWEIRASHRFADDGDARRGRNVFAAEFTALQQGDPHHSK